MVLGVKGVDDRAFALKGKATGGNAVSDSAWQQGGKQW